MILCVSHICFTIYGIFKDNNIYIMVNTIWIFFSITLKLFLRRTVVQKKYNWTESIDSSWNKWLQYQYQTPISGSEWKTPNLLSTSSFIIYCY